MICTDCKMRPICTKICRKLLATLGLVEKRQTDLIPVIPVSSWFNLKPVPWGEVDITHPALPRRLKEDGMKVAEIGYHLPTETRQLYRKVS